MRFIVVEEGMMKKTVFIEHIVTVDLYAGVARICTSDGATHLTNGLTIEDVHNKIKRAESIGQVGGPND